MDADFPDHDLYDELEISPRASSEVIEAAYRGLMRVHHPDVSARADGGKAARLNEAFAVLGDAERRSAYDAWRNARSAAANETTGDQQRGQPPNKPVETRLRNLPSAEALGWLAAYAWYNHRRESIIAGAVIALLLVAVGIGIRSSRASGEPSLSFNCHVSPIENQAPLRTQGLRAALLA